MFNDERKETRIKKETKKEIKKEIKPGDCIPS